MNRSKRSRMNKRTSRVQRRGKRSRRNTKRRNKVGGLTNAQLLAKADKEIDLDSAKDLVNTRKLFYQGRNIMGTELEYLFDIFTSGGKKTYGEFNTYLTNLENLLKERRPDGFYKYSRDIAPTIAVDF
jgi:hypothetical protein